MTNKEKGYIGEEAAVQFLMRLGYDILERNYTVRGGEIDVIAKDADTVVFAEVKTRTRKNECASEAVDEVKISRILKGAERYISEKSEAVENLSVRFDCIEVYVSTACETEIRHIKNIDVT